MEKLKPMQWLQALGGRSYQEFMENEGIPVHEALGGVDDSAELPRKPWARMGGSGCYITLLGFTQAERGVYVAEIPGGGALNPEKHMYEEAIFVIRGRGLTEVWQEGGAKVTFEWGENSVFGIPLNTHHRLINGSREPALVVGMTNAPQMMNLAVSNDFIFNCDYQFLDRFGGESSYFDATDKRYTYGAYAKQGIWETNFIPDSMVTFLDGFEQKIAGGQLTGYRMGARGPNGHISEWPVGVYTKAHYHGPGAFLMGLKGKGYVLVWPCELGGHPYQNGHEDQVIKIDWGPRSIYSPPDAYYHQHFNTSKEPARHVASYGFGERPENRASTFAKGDEIPVLVSEREGGTLLDYEDEDPEVRRQFEAEIKEAGVSSQMPAVTYR